MGRTNTVKTEAGEPTTIKEARASPDTDEWRQAMEETLYNRWEKGRFKHEELVEHKADQDAQRLEAETKGKQINWTIQRTSRGKVVHSSPRRGFRCSTQRPRHFCFEYWTSSKHT